MSSIETTIIGNSLISGSTDFIRKMVDGGWKSSDRELTLPVLEFTAQRAEEPESYKISSEFSSLKTKFGFEGEPTDVDSSTLIKSKQVPIRIYGSNLVKDDRHWKSIFLGGTFGDSVYQRHFTDDVFDNFILSLKKPYPAAKASKLKPMHLDEIQISYQYNKYLPAYQLRESNLESELLSTNHYFLNDVMTYAETDRESYFDSGVINSIDIDGQVDAIENLTSSIFLDDKKPQYRFTSNTSQWIQNKFENILMDDKVMNKVYRVDEINSAKTPPYHIDIKFPTDSRANFYDSIVSNDYSPRFLKTLFEVFGGTSADVKVDTTPALLNKKLFTASDAPPLKEDSITSNVDMRTIDYLSFLEYSHDNQAPSAENNIFLGKKDVYRNAAQDGSKSSNRFLNSAVSLSTLGDAVSFLNNIEVSSLKDILRASEIHSETVAYRVEKSDEFGNIIQNYWLMNILQEEINLLDSQVKVDKKYTYAVYAYKIVVGTKHRVTNLLLSNQIGCADEESKSGLLFYNALDESETSVASLFGSSPSDTLRNSGDAEITFSMNKFLADMYLQYEPFVKLVEVPIFSKDIKITDHPAGDIEITPYQVMDKSHKIGFEMRIKSSIKSTFPLSLSATEETIRETYLTSNDLESSDKFSKQSISPTKTINIYRLKKKPNSLSDFEGNLFKTVDLKKEKMNFYNTTDFFETIMKVNQKEYFLFRAVSEQNIVGHISLIYQAELVEDGGYIYSIFNTLSEVDLDKTLFVNTSKMFKNLLQFVPRLEHLELNTSKLDYSEEAASQIDNLAIGNSEDPIWDKTFKVRLVSNKTGKKIDLNITYELGSDY